MLISLLTFTAFFVYMLKAPLWKKAILVAFAFPLSTFVNGVRIASIGYIGIWTGSSKAMFKFHDTWAMAFELILSFAILFGFARLIRANDFGVPDPSRAPDPSAAPSRRPVGAGPRGVAVIVVLALALLTNYMVRPLEVTAKGILDPTTFAKTFGHWVAEDVPLDPVTAKELKTAAMMHRVYRYTIDDLPFVQVLIQAAADTDAFHDPHSCIPGGGSSIVDEKTVLLEFDTPVMPSAHATSLRSVSALGDEFVLVYWYRTENETYATTSQVRWKMRQAQIKDMSDLLFRRADNEDVRRRTAKRQTYCYRFTAVLGSDADRDRDALLEFIKDFVENSSHARNVN
jgi:exosortase/archaeosortase family protein